MDIQLYYVKTFHQSIDHGGYVYNDDMGAMNYHNPSNEIYEGAELLFNSSDDLLKFIYKNPKKLIPRVYLISYLDNCKGLDDVIKVIDLEDDITKYYTALNKCDCIYYDERRSELYGIDVWDTDESKIVNLERIYQKFSECGVKIKCNVYETDEDKKNYFSFVGDPYGKNLENAVKTKKPILYKAHYCKPPAYGFGLDDYAGKLPFNVKIKKF